MATEIEYHGQKIVFREKNEEWEVLIDGKANAHKSLQMVKNYVDRLNKKAFTRIPVYLAKQTNGYSWSSSRHEGYVKGFITSVTLDGTIFVVREGQKHANHCGQAWVQSDKNEKLIAKLEDLRKQEEKIKKMIDDAEEQMVAVDFEPLRKQVLGQKNDS